MTGRPPLDAPPPAPRVATLACPQCAAPLELKAQGWAESVVCASCGSVLDASDGTLGILQAFDQAVRLTPAIPLGSRGTWRGVLLEVIGCQEVAITVEGTDYAWREYVCFNPYRGFLYLSEYEGHWNVIEKLQKRPVLHGGAHPTATLDGQHFKHFQSAMARTTAALGEFPWQLRVGDAVQVADYVNPPFLLSAEGTDDERTWSLGTYTPADAIFRAFGLRTWFRGQSGVFANQPNPHAEGATRARRYLVRVLLLLVLVFGAHYLVAGRTVAFQQRYQITPAGTLAGTDDDAFVTPAFALEGRASNVQLELDTDLDNGWLYFTLALINEATGDTRSVGREVSYYHGSDGSESWWEGSRDEQVVIGQVPAGRYLLRVGVEGDSTLAVAARPPHAVTLTVRRDVPMWGPYGLAFLALLLPGIVAPLRASSFEGRRWAESDHAPVASDDDDE